MNKWIKCVAAAVVTAALWTATGSQAADIKERTLKFAFQNPKEHPQGLGAQKFAELVSQRSGGKITVKLFPGGTLGGDLQTVSALQGGTIDLTVLNSGLLSGLVKEFALFDLPFLFNDAREADAVTDGAFGKALADKLVDKGLVGLGYWDLGFRNVTNSKRPITRLEDFQGLKIRVVQSPVYIDTFNTLGANAVPLPFPEVYTALEQKTVDGEENPFTVIERAKFQEVQKYLSVTRHIYNPQSFIVSRKSWDKLSADERAILAAAAAEAQEYQRRVSREQQTQALETLKKSMQINEIGAPEMARIRDKVKPVVDKFARESGEALASQMFAEIARVRGGK